MVILFLKYSGIIKSSKSIKQSFYELKYMEVKEEIKRLFNVEVIVPTKPFPRIKLEELYKVLDYYINTYSCVLVY